MLPFLFFFLPVTRFPESTQKIIGCKYMSFNNLETEDDSTSNTTNQHQSASNRPHELVETISVEFNV